MVEDDPRVRALLVETLGEAGYEVRAAADGAGALNELRPPAPPPDLLVVDIMMPDVDGVNLVKAIKEDRKNSAIPVIFLTARSDPQSMAAGVGAGARYYVTKPFHLDDLLAKIDKALARR